jgi:hypothetical protein
MVNGEAIWACSLPDCYHHMPHHYERLMLGKRSICWQCGEETVIMDDRAMKMDMPICITCASGISDNELLEKIGEQK